MHVYPAVLERAIRAALLLLPLAAVLFLAGQEGDASLALVGIVVGGATVYGVVVWLAEGRRTVREQAAATPPAPSEATVEPLARTTLRGLPALVVAVVGGYLAARFDVLAIVLVILGGTGLSIALQAVSLSRAERREPGRLVREPDGPLLRF